MQQERNRKAKTKKQAQRLRSYSWSHETQQDALLNSFKSHTVHCKKKRNNSLECIQ